MRRDTDPGASSPPLTARERAAAWLAPLAGAALGCVRMTSFDLPLMIASGDRLLATGDVPTTNPWNWVHPGFPWLDDKWLFGVLCAAAERLDGAAGLTALNVLLGAAAGWMLYALARRGTTAAVAAGAATAAVTLLSYRSMLRAEWISYLGVVWTLLHLGRVVAGDVRSAAWVVLAVPLWAASHVYWVLGPALVLVAAAAGLSWRGALVGVAALAAGAASPYGFDNLAHPFRIAASAGDLQGAIAELRRPFLSGGPFTYLHAVAALLLVATLWASRERMHGILRLPPERRAACAAVLLLLVGALQYDRNLPLLAAAFAFAVSSPRDAARRWPAWTGWLAVPAVLGLAGGVSWLAPERSRGFGWEERAFPFRLVASLPPETRGHRYVNDFSVGSFLDWTRGASFIDGNTHGYPAAHFALYRSALDGTTSVAEVDARHPNDGWLLRTSAPTTRVLVVGLFLEGDYAPTDSDDVATLFRAVPDPEQADALWRRWLADRYLPTARAWFPSRDEALAAAGGTPTPDDANAWRRLVVASPWERAFLDGLRAAYDARGAARPAARVWRLARRLGN
jgi:hypothetical protein